ncbi:MAG: Gfo/Idh/MocA family oxidoreductase [Verrucomicrobia bacterium]|nr:Gfo/Idh/MocA family oxidoreductase [Verrucomicrobiota bacterium]MBU1735329.1 Gfo/Idh/MocA family oxidoreductase [Verrucomicrobiota bacterium]MBU1855431.1 Gfo/Idh/MocA family oxidoreductase [Verrucomicrobiota bacterium]
MSKIRVAFMGFRHMHIGDVYRRLQNRADAEIVAACEEDEAARRALSAESTFKITHDSFEAMLAETPADVIAVGDYYGKRGRILIQALEHGCHVISDKPVCTSLQELDQIEKLAAAKRLVVGCQLDQRDGAASAAARMAIQAGEIGEVHAISFGGQHPLMFGTRPGWYFEPGKHGGTINDIAIHAINSIPRITGRRFTMINSARNWNARLKEVPQFKDAAQMMLTMDNGCGVLGDVSYLMPDSFGYGHPLYWRFLFWGSAGILDVASGGVTLYKNGEKTPRVLPLPAVKPGQYLESFLNEIKGTHQPDELSTQEVLTSARITLMIQRAADDQVTNLPL